MSDKKLRLTLTKSLIARLPRHKACIKTLGLRRIRHTVEVADTQTVRGIINQVSYLLLVEEV